VARQGFLQRLLIEVQDVSDVLSQLNAVEILSAFAESEHGFRFSFWLLKTGVSENQADRYSQSLFG
jgi:hypothetical protein